MKRIALCLGLLLLAPLSVSAQHRCPCGVTCDCGPNCPCEQKAADPVVLARAMLALAGDDAPAKVEEQSGVIAELALTSEEQAGNLTLAPVCRLLSRVRARLRGGSQTYSAADEATYSVNGQSCSAGQMFSAYAFAPAGASYPVTFNLVPGTDTFRSMAVTVPGPNATAALGPVVNQAAAAAAAADALKAMPAPRAAAAFPPADAVGSQGEYDAAYNRAVETRQALVVSVKCPARRIDGAVCIRWDEYGKADADVVGAAVVVALPDGAGGLKRAAVHPQGVEDTTLMAWARMARQPAQYAAPAPPAVSYQPAATYSYVAGDAGMWTGGQCAGGNCQPAAGRRFRR